jgi:hypothetical protein
VTIPSLTYEEEKVPQRVALGSHEEGTNTEVVANFSGG